MENSLLFGEAVWPAGFVVLMVLGGSLIVLALYCSRFPKPKSLSRFCICEKLKNRVTHSRIGKMLIRKDQGDEQVES